MTEQPTLAEAARLAEARQMIAHRGTGYVPTWAELTDREREVSTREARNWLRALDAIGLLLPAGTRSVEQFAARVTLDGQPVEAIPEAITRELAQQRVDYHTRQQATNGLWRGSAELVHRQQHTTPWEPTPVDQHRQDHDAILEALDNVRFRFWVCPVREHAERNFGTDGLVVTVEWRGDVAYCTFPDCKRNSQQTTKDEEAP